MLIVEPPIHISPSLALAFGFNEAAVIQEIHFWLNPNVSPHFSPYFKKGRYWAPDIFSHLCQRFFFWEVDMIAYMCAGFEQSGILMVMETENPLSDSEMTKYYTLNYEILREKSGVKPFPVLTCADEDPDMPSSPEDPVMSGETDSSLAANGNINMGSSFTATIHQRGFDVYAMEIQDSPQFLACELLLEIQDMPEKVTDRSFAGGKCTEEGKGAVPKELSLREAVCHFPRVADAQLKEFIWEDPVLYKIVMVTFQMNALDQLFSFCATHKALRLSIFADNVGDLKIYQDFLVHKNGSKVSDRSGNREGEVRAENTGIIIPVDHATLDAWGGFRKTVLIRFRRILWTGRKTNLAIRHYLKLRPAPEF